MSDVVVRLLRNHLVLINIIFCGVIGIAFGFVSRAPIPWVASGVTVGVLIGVLAKSVFKAAKLPKRYYFRGALVILILEALTVIYVVIPSYSAYLTVHPAKPDVLATPSDIGLIYEDAVLVTEDGLRLIGWYIPSENGAAIIAVHGLSGNRTRMFHYLFVLAEHGYGVLAFDMRAHGESDGERFAGTWDSGLDVLAALDYLDQREDVEQGRVGALGLSAGANAVLYGAAKTEKINAILVDGTGMGRTEDALEPLLPELRPLFFMTPMNWMHHKMIEVFSGYPAGEPIKEQVILITPRPILFVASGTDRLERALARRYHSLAGESSELWIIPDAAHCAGITKHPEEYIERMISFFDSSLLDRVSSLRDEAP